MTNQHPTFAELDIAAREPEQATATLDHVDGCILCQARLARIYDALESTPPSEDTLQRLMRAAPPLPTGVAELILAPRVGDPQPGEIWRAGRTEAVLVWVRRVFDDGVADVVPLVMDVELADETTLLLGPETTVLDAPLAAMASLRTHVDFGAFINRFGAADLADAVTEVMAAMREGRRPVGVQVGPPILDDADRRIEYRCAVRDVLADLTPEAWATHTSGDHGAPDGG
jgi:hypothetical protein